MGVTFIQSGRFGAAAFDPFSVGWYAACWADDPLWSNPGDGAAVSTWRDGTGNGRTPVQATGSFQPIFRSSVALLNGRAAVDFDGVDDYLQSAAFGSSQANPTLVWIGKRDGAGGGANERLIDVVGDVAPYTSLFMRVSTGKWSSYSGAYKDSSVSYDTTAGHAIRLRAASGANSRIVVDGTTTTYTGAAGDTASHFAIGGYSAIAADRGNQHTAFAGVFVGDVTADGNWSAFVTWVSTYYGLTMG